MKKININKLISQRSNYSRRQAENLVRQGLVSTKERIIQLGEEFNPQEEIFVKGKKLATKKEENLYLKLNKPPGYTCTRKSFIKEKNIFSLLPFQEKLFIMGRLDKNSRGLVILSNDGDLIHKITHPSFAQQKKYLVKLAPDKRLENISWLKKIKKHFKIGISIQEKNLARADDIKYLGQNQFQIILSQGQKRQIRKMFEFFNFQVIDLQRIEIAGVKLENLKEGNWKYLNLKELNLLKS
ncbi:MAG: pseudouridine synthase [Patescibacteria group bacterium]|jgi:pseudouridine synthase